jgi:hypothetical protein
MSTIDDEERMPWDTPLEQRIARLEAMPEAERNELLATNARELYDFDDDDIPNVKAILTHFWHPIPKTMSSPAPVSVPDRSAYNSDGYDKYANHWSHSEESKQDNIARIAAMEEAKLINVHKHGKPRMPRGEQIGNEHPVYGVLADQQPIKSQLSDRLGTEADSIDHTPDPFKANGRVAR